MLGCFWKISLAERKVVLQDDYVQKGILCLITIFYLGSIFSPLNSFGSAYTVEIDHSHQHTGAHDHHHHHETCSHSDHSSHSSERQDGESNHTHSICISHCSPVWLQNSFTFVIQPTEKQVLHPFAPAVFSSVNLGAIFRPPIA